ncbi:MAG TPA: alpha-glucan family phosphorylase, partial [Symbiobacteriaceae bacterium]|nr:alpha-glucan family phosphorylase [Symbiobacteriaceae bacterium]
CGTSGMKAAMNGVLHLSTPDGWWPEAVRHGENGWAFGGGEYGDVDAYDANQLADVMTNEVIPTYYTNRDKWHNMMRTSIDTTREPYSAHRMVRQYDEQVYRAKMPVGV